MGYFLPCIVLFSVEQLGMGILIGLVVFVYLVLAVGPLLMKQSGIPKDPPKRKTTKKKVIKKDIKRRM